MYAGLLDVAERNAFVETGQRHGENGSGIALCENDVRLLVNQDLVEFQ